MATADKLSYLLDTKAAIKAAIINHGVSVSDTDTFRSYADKIRAISSGSTLSSLEDEIIQDTLTSYTNDRVIKIKDSMFRGSEKLESVSFANVTSIGDYAISFNEHLASINLPLCTNAGEGAFYSNYSLIFINLPKLETIGEQGFEYCDVLETIELPSITSIPAECFLQCSSLESLILSGSTMATLSHTNAFTGTPIAEGLGYIYVPADLVDTYKAATNWQAYANQIVAIQ